MEERGMSKTGLLAAITLLASLVLAVGSAAAATTLKVTTTADEVLSGSRSPGVCEAEPSDACSLRAAVELADDEGGEFTIEVPAGTYAESSSLGALPIGSDKAPKVRIAGAGAATTSIVGDGEESVLEVFETGSSLTIDGVTVTGGVEDEGGGIFSDDGASLVVEHSTITENFSDDRGGGIYGEAGTSITVKDSVVSKNSADGIGGGIAIVSGASLTVERTLISENGAGYAGGGIGDEFGSTARIDESKIIQNFANEAGGVGAGLREQNGCQPAAAHRTAGARTAVKPTTTPTALAEGLTIEKTAIEENAAQAGNGGGVGILVLRELCDTARARTSKRIARPAISDFEEGQFRISQSTIARNRAEAGDSERSFEEQGLGGGVYDEGVFDDPIVDSTIADNQAANDGGGMAATGETLATLISDTVYDNKIEAPREEAKARPDSIVDSEGPGDNLYTETPSDSDGESVIALRNTIVAEPEGSNLENCEGQFESLGYNLDFPTTSLADSATDTCGMSETGHDLVGVAPGLEANGLQNHGGPTDTIALEANSKAIGVVPVAGDCEEAEDGPGSVDQRGEKRPGIAGKGCDVGAYEYQEPAKSAQKTEEKKSEPKKEEPKPAAGVLPIKISRPLQCTSKRFITVHIQNVKQFGIVSAVVSIDGKHKRALTGKELKTGINLRGLPKGTFKIEIVAHTAGGQTLRGERVYHTCRFPPLHGHAHLRL
jgi:hypothetical protein